MPARRARTSFTHDPSCSKVRVRNLWRNIFTNSRRIRDGTKTPRCVVKKEGDVGPPVRPSLLFALPRHCGLNSSSVTQPPCLQIFSAPERVHRHGTQTGTQQW